MSTHMRGHQAEALTGVESLDQDIRAAVLQRLMGCLCRGSGKYSRSGGTMTCKKVFVGE